MVGVINELAKGEIAELSLSVLINEHGISSCATL